LADFEIPPTYHNIGKTLKEIHMRQNYGVNIVSIVRGEKRINIPDGDERIYPYDHIVVVGTDHQLMRFSYTMEESATAKFEFEKKDVHLQQLVIEENSKLIGKTIETAKLRDKYRCMVIGIERNHNSKMNPEIHEEFRIGDVLWLAGEKLKIQELIKDHH
jgi:CPA2 family monovalent cation:H+ antiporter-2